MEITLSKIHVHQDSGNIIIDQEPYMYIIFIAIYYIEHASCGVEKNR